MVLNISIGVLLALTIAFGSVKAACAECLPFFIYGYNGKYVHFPKDASFCVDSDDGKLRIKSDRLGGRVIPPLGRVYSDLNFFGESQLFGFDVSGAPGSHELNKVYGGATLVFYGAPNNGPFETLEYLKYVLREKKDLKQVVIGFNYGTDVFRLMPDWDPSKFVALESKDLPFYLINPFLYEARLTLELLGGRFFTAARPSNSRLRFLYKSLDKDILRVQVHSFFSRLLKIAVEFDVKVDLIVFPPYWGLKSTDTGEFIEVTSVSESYYRFVCNTLSQFGSIRSVMVAKPNLKKQYLFTSDKRHFAQNVFSYSSRDGYCSVHLGAP